MEYLELLGSSLKCEVLLDLFETYDVDVVYCYDRTHEDMEDEYRAEIDEMGLEFIFDSSQRLKTLFMKKVDHNGFNPFCGSDPRGVPFNTGLEAVEWASVRSINATNQEARVDPTFGEIAEWVKLNFETFSMHYEFNGDSVEVVTLQVIMR